MVRKVRKNHPQKWFIRFGKSHTKWFVRFEISKWFGKSATKWFDEVWNVPQNGSDGSENHPPKMVRQVRKMSHNISLDAQLPVLQAVR